MKQPFGTHDCPEEAVFLRAVPAFLAAWVLAGLGAVTFPLMGHGAGKPGLIAGALVEVLLRDLRQIGRCEGEAVGHERSRHVGSHDRLDERECRIPPL
jgi:hypothetical protein